MVDVTDDEDDASTGDEGADEDVERVSSAFQTCSKVVTELNTSTSLPCVSDEDEETVKG